MEKTIIQRVISFLFGIRYYINIVCTKGIGKYEACSFIFTNKEDAMRHKRDLQLHNMSFVYVETVSFRSQLVYPPVER